MINNDVINIGIVGFGFVGSAVVYGFSPQTGCDFTKIRIYDKDPLRSANSISDVASLSDIIFLSVPTPAKKSDGSIDLSMLFSALSNIDHHRVANRPIVLLRSTMIPGTSRKVQEKFKNLNIVTNPEFLTERSARLDFINQSRIVLGGNKSSTNKVKKLYKRRFGDHIPVIETDYETAELIKYMCNCFFATKISFMNEMYRICQSAGADWHAAVEGFVLDGRIGKSHITVPGFDKKFGYGGSCFPKDMQAIINFSKDLNVNANTVEAAWKTNLEVRPEKDWEKFEGRTVTNSPLPNKDK